MKIKLETCYIKHQRIINSVLMFVIVMICLLGFTENSLFVTDEEEIFIKGMAVAKGQYLYKDIVSQHMPLMYYFAAFFSAIGVHSVTGFRIAFYFFIAILWAVLQFRYGKIFSNKVIWIYALGYMAVSSYIAQGTNIISEQIQQFGIIILLLEFMIFIERKKIELSNAIFISLAIVLSFGSAFVSVFAIAVVFVAVAIYIFKMVKEGNKDSRKKIAIDCIKLLTVIMLPWICYIVYLVCTNTLKDAFYWNYTFNREIYSEYTGGYGQSVFGAYLNGVTSWISMWTFQTSLVNNLNVYTLLGLFVILYMIQIIKKGQVYLGVSCIIYTFACATRGVTLFHGLPCIAVECLFMALYLNQIIGKKSLIQFLKELKTYQLAGGLGIVFVVLASMGSQIGDIVNKEPINQLKNEDSAASIVQKLTDENEAVGFAGVSYDILVEADRIMLNKNPASPWIWDAAKEEIIDSLEKQKPRVIIYQGTTSVWGYVLNEFAEELDDFINTEYTNLDVIEHKNIYVRNDYYEEVLDILDVPAPLFEMSDEDVSVTRLLGDEDEIRIEYKTADCEIESFAIRYGTYQKDDVASFSYQLQCKNSGKVLSSGMIEGDSIIDNKYAIVKLKKAVECKEGLVYELVLTVDCEKGEEISMYTNEGNEQIKCYINYKPVDGDIDVLFYGNYVE